MNYRHAFHAGNFADVVKHIVLARIVTYLGRKPSPYRVIDTHAGAGLYDLAGVEATKTGEWRDGVGRLLRATLSAPSEAVIAPYREAIARLADIQNDTPRFYPGSPLIAAALMRAGDTLIANELHEADAETLRRSLAHARRRAGPVTKVTTQDAWQAVKALLPPRERRGLVIIDPPFERPSEFEDLARGLAEARRRFANGIYLVWYPVKDRKAADRLVELATDFGAEAHRGPSSEGTAAQNFVDIRLAVSLPFPGLGLTEAGVLVINPPYTLASEMATVMADLVPVLAESVDAGFAITANPA